ncbi:hypothetical protein [Mucilaginibacter lacusdianchii]|uniref:hypothetical protein n=1 Tax=Mucilaginibacter lacusdianchii TaxID=2684211 RepID=UPI00131E1269|nr:hypothetical protein [Mucilaginibacter sp. JXJ CY 39]
MKQDLPESSSSVSKDSIQTLNAKTGTAYVCKHKREGKHTKMKPFCTKWSPEAEKLIKEAYDKQLINESAEIRREYCNCVISKLKKVYPDSILAPPPKEVMVKFKQECKIQLGELI